MEFNGRNVSCWPAPLRRAVDSIAVMLMHVYMLARGRAAASASPTVKAMAGRDEEAWKLAIREREIGVFRRRLDSMAPHKRPQIVPEDRFEILQLMRLRGLSPEQAAERYVLHPNTIRGWIKQFRRGTDVGAFFGKAPFNKIGDAARWLVHEIRRLCPEQEFGTRSIAMVIVRAGIQLSRSSVQRILRERTPEEVYGAIPKPEALPARRCDPPIALCSVRRVHAGGDHHLPLLDIRHVRHVKKIA